ncbi:MAG: DNA polymerase Y family protein [Comamonadaceae bacterium]|nr:MAG: DNA polymerase Y family protein [Comamonadaceae bacterium]
MHWIALLPSPEDERMAWGWWALRFTPRVAQVDEALLLEIAGSERLFGGRNRLLRRIFEPDQAPAHAHWAQGATSLIALAMLRLKTQGLQAPNVLPDGLPLETLTAALEHLPTLQRTGCRNWGDLRALPRGGMARRFGAPLLDALDAAWGQRPERYPWLTLPEVFDQKLELPALATGAPELMWSAQRLLSQLQVWLQARHHGVLALELEWTLDLRRLNGVQLPSHEQLVVRTAQPTQDIAHLRRLVAEHLARARLSAPANHLRLRTLETLPWAGASTSFLPEDNVKGEKLHQLVERLSVRLGEGNVTVPVACEDHRPECKQQWVPARQRLGSKPPLRQLHPADILYPPWLLPRPVRLEFANGLPQYDGPVRRLTRMQRIETAWWENGRPVVRDYCVGRSEKAGLLWIYREQSVREVRGERQTQVHWYLQGLYA